jgi:hypothetical protein
LPSTGHTFIKPKAMKPIQNSNFNFLSKCKLNGINSFGMNPSMYWMKFQMMMKQPSSIGDLTNMATLKPSLRENNLSGSFDSDVDDGKAEAKMVGRLTDIERKTKVDRYLQKKRRKSKAIRYECRK